MKKINRLWFIFALIIPASMAVSQELNISGTVVSKSTGETLPGANVVVVGTRIGAVTDANGKFTLKLENMSEARLTVSYIGYRSADVTVKQSTETLEISLKDDALKGEEIIVTGLATSVKRENLANTVATVSAKELVGAVPAQTIDAALAGKAAGISISQNTGAPGGGINIKAPPVRCLLSMASLSVTTPFNPE